MADLDPTAIKAAHAPQVMADEGEDWWCDECQTVQLAGDYCEPYRLADALEAEQARTARVRALPHIYVDAWDREAIVADELAEALDPEQTPHATTATVRSEPQSRPREEDGSAWDEESALRAYLGRGYSEPQAGFVAWLNSRGVDDGLG